MTKFYADRGPHLAAMIAYFGLLSSVSLIFLALAILGYTGRAEESSYLVKELQHLFPSQGINDIVTVVKAITSNATTLGVIGSVFLLWTSLSLFSVLESAFNIVYRRPNRSFLRGKFLASLFMAGSIVILVAALFVGSVGYDLLQSLRTGSHRQRHRCLCGLRPRLDHGGVRLPGRGVRAADECLSDAWARSGRAPRSQRCCCR